jgi:hypothetical protein
MVQVFGPRMLRYKGVLYMENAERKVIFQGVHQIMGTDLGAKWEDGETKQSKMVFIGKNLPKEALIQDWSNVWYKLTGYCAGICLGNKPRRNPAQFGEDSPEPHACFHASYVLTRCIESKRSGN